ncbi:MAG: alpha/beta hydrolase family esterase [Flavobacteriales bacterium]
MQNNKMMFCSSTIIKRSCVYLQLLFLFVALSSCSNSQVQIVQVKDFGENKGNLKMYNYVPENLPESTRVPLVFVLHGCTQSAEQIASETGWNKLADSLHFIVVYPEQRMINNVGKCFNFFLGFESKKDKGEVASIKEMIDYTFNHYNIDSNQVFIVGMSAGGAMTNALLNAYPTIFKSGAMLAAPSNLFDKNTLPPEQQPVVAIVQGEDDIIVPEKNSDKILNQWVEKHQLDTANNELFTNYKGVDVLYAQYFYNTDDELKIILLKSKKVKHKLLITEGDSIHQGGKHDFHTDDIGFHSTYWLASFFGLTKDAISLKKVSN